MRTIVIPLAASLFVLPFQEVAGSKPQEVAPIEAVELAGVAPLHKVGGLYLAGQPSRAALEALAERGVLLVIDLRKADEARGYDEASSAKELGLQYVNPGFRRPEDLTDELFDGVREQLREREGQGVLLHCASSNRVGAVWLTSRVLDDGVPWEQALEEAHRVGLGYAPFEARAREYVLGPQPERWAKLKERIRKEFPKARTVGVRELAARLAKEGPAPLLIDARSAEEFAVSRLRGAQRAETKKEALALLEGQPKDREVVVYCSVGYRSARLTEELGAAGYSGARNLEGSLFEWANTGRPVYQGERRVRRVHPYDEDWGQLLRRSLWPAPAEKE